MRQFELIRNDRPNEAEFLYALKLSYDIGLERILDSVKKMQKSIFNSDSPSEPSRTLSTWTYMVLDTYAMPDVARQSIEYPPERRRDIMGYLSTEDFLSAIPDEEYTSYSFGVFFGENLKFLPNIQLDPFPNSNIHNYMKRNIYFIKSP